MNRDTTGVSVAKLEECRRLLDKPTLANLAAVMTILASVEVNLAGDFEGYLEDFEDKTPVAGPIAPERRR